MKQKKSKRLTKILLALDGSEISRNTANTSIEVAKLFCLKILGLYVVDEELVVNDYADYQKELGLEKLSLSRPKKEALFETRGREILQWLKSRCEESGVRVTTEIGVGGVWDMTLIHAKEASLLALGRRGNGHPAEPNYLGTNFRHIAHRLNIPLFVGGDKVPQIKKILLAYNGEGRAQKALAWAKKFQDHASCELITLVVRENNKPDSNKDWLEEIKSQLHRSQIGDFQLIIKRGDPSDQIVKVAIKTESNLIIMGGYRHKTLLEWLEGSTLDEVLRRTRLPVLVA